MKAKEKGKPKTAPPRGKNRRPAEVVPPPRLDKAFQTSAAGTLFRLFAKKYSRKEYLDALVELLQEWTGCNSVGVRIVDKDGNIPYSAYVGFPKGFWESENMLSIREHECVCTRVARGEPDPQDLPYITPGGSFHCEDTLRFVGCLTEDQKKRFRGLCLSFGYASVSVIPVRHRQRVVGVIHLADCEKGKVPQKTVGFIESLCPVIGEAVYRFTLEEELLLSESRYKALFNNSPAGIIRTTLDGRLLDANPAIARMFGYESPEQAMREVYDLGLQHYVNPEDRGRIVEHLKRYGSITQWTVSAYRRNGEVRWITITARLVRAGGKVGSFIEGIVEDITDRKRVEDERARLAMAVEQAAEGIVITDAASLIEYINPAFEQMTGFARNDLIGLPISRLGMGKGDECLDAAIRRAHALGGFWKGQTTNERKDGTPYQAECSVSAVRGTSGEIINYVLIHRDVSREMKLEQQLRHSQKMEALGTLAGGVAHDFNNILAAIVGFAEMAIQKTADEGVRKRMEQALAAGLRGKELVKQILAFTRRNEPELRPVLLRDSVESILSLLGTSLPPTLKIRFKAEKEPAFVLGDAGQIEQLILNLVNNGAQAMGGKKGILNLRVRKVFFDNPSNLPHKDLKPGKYVELTVSDSGVGMDEATVQRIFDPFYTTKARGEGTGLGLSVAHGIVQSHNGAITVESEPGKGSTFRAYFPALSEEASVPLEQHEDIRGGTERILLVDDEIVLVRMTQDMLEDLGYTVTGVSSSKEALLLFERDPGAYDLVITDEVMPEMTGSQLARRLWGIRHDIPVVLVTGYSERMDEIKARKMGIKAFLMKPLSKLEIASSIRRIMDDHNPQNAGKRS